MILKNSQITNISNETVAITADPGAVVTLHILCSYPQFPGFITNTCTSHSITNAAVRMPAPQPSVLLLLWNSEPYPFHVCPCFKPQLWSYSTSTTYYTMMSLLPWARPVLWENPSVTISWWERKRSGAAIITEDSNSPCCHHRYTQYWLLRAFAITINTELSWHSCTITVVRIIAPHPASNITPTKEGLPKANPAYKICKGVTISLNAQISHKEARNIKKQGDISPSKDYNNLL